MHKRRRYAVFAPIIVLVVMATIGAFGQPSEAGGKGSALPTASVTLDGQSAGRLFDGVGVQSASSSRLLYDYPEPQRSQLLDYLFKPDYGASLDTLEVEIGSDVNSTTVAEPSHMRTAGDVDCDRGVEWWLMEQAAARNPNIKLAGLAWGFPGWVGKLWSAQQVDYIGQWLQCAQQHNLTIAYIGGSNQRQVGSGTIPSSFLAALRAAAKAVFPDIQVIASDQGGTPPYWKFANEILTDPQAAASVDVIGETTICGWLSQYKTCDGPDDPTWQNAVATGKPLWDSSASTADATAGGGLIARSLNRSYLQAQVTGHDYWSATSAVYGDLWDTGIGLMDAQWPWSGYYVVGSGIWAIAQTTQFVQPGWRYLDDSSGFLSNGASYVTMRSPQTDDYSTVIETMDATSPVSLTLTPSGGLSTGSAELWSTDLANPSDATSFQDDGTIKPVDGKLTLTVQPGFVYTLSTTHGQHKGTGKPQATADQHLPLPYSQDFDSTPIGGEAAYFNTPNGGFEAAPCGAGRTGTCYRQVVNTSPIIWQRGGNMAPTTVVGDPLWSGNYTVSTDAMLEAPGTVSLIGRVERVNKDSVVGYFLSISDTGAWKLYYENQGDSWQQNWNGPAGSAVDTVLASGTGSFGVGQWHQLSISFNGSSIAASLDGDQLAAVQDSHSTSGQVGLRVGGWQNAQFDDLQVVPTGAAPRTLPASGMSATATSTQAGPYQYLDFDPSRALDGRAETEWMSSFCDDVGDASWDNVCPSDDVAPLPQSITIDMKHENRVGGLIYKPPVGNSRVNPDGIITSYNIYVSTDGKHFTKVASGDWSLDIGTKTVTWQSKHPVRYVRLEATAADGGVAGASELRIIAG